MERTKSKNWKDTLLEVHKLCSFHEVEMILDSEKRSTYDELYFFKRGIKMAYRQEGYEESWIELLLKMIDVRVYRADDCDDSLFLRTIYTIRTKVNCSDIEE